MLNPIYRFPGEPLDRKQLCLLINFPEFQRLRDYAGRGRAAFLEWQIAD